MIWAFGHAYSASLRYKIIPIPSDFDYTCQHGAAVWHVLAPTIGCEVLPHLTRVACVRGERSIEQATGTLQLDFGVFQSGGPSYTYSPELHPRVTPPALAPPTVLEGAQAVARLLCPNSIGGCPDGLRTPPPQFHPLIGLLHPTGANDVLEQLQPYVSDFFLSFFLQQFPLL